MDLFINLIEIWCLLVKPEKLGPLLTIYPIRIFEQNGGKYEIVVYAAQRSNLKRMLPICTNWETACWAMAKSWLEIQVDLELASSQPGRMEQLKSNGEVEGVDATSQPSTGPESWPLQVLNQQPRDPSKTSFWLDSEFSLMALFGRRGRVGKGEKGRFPCGISSWNGSFQI
ncbi:hypothetical protein GQ457_01G021810 [Hibiscus cannabinus]